MGIINGNTFYFEFEVRLMEFLQRTLGERVIDIFSSVSAFGEETMLILIMGLLFWCLDKECGIYVGTNLIVGLVLNPMIKNIFWRRRPYFDNESIICYRAVDSSADLYDIQAQGFSFPSGHSTHSATEYGSIARYKKNKMLTFFAYLIPFSVGLSRIVVGAHYPTDVLAGWILGLFIIFFVPFFIKKFGEEKRYIAFICIFLFSCIGLFYCKTSDYFTGLGLMGGFFLAVEFEKRKVKFQMPSKKLFWITRLIGGMLLYAIINMLLKALFLQLFVSAGFFMEGIARVIRYMAVSFCVIGVYPIVFKLEQKF